MKHYIKCIRGGNGFNKNMFQNYKVYFIKYIITFYFYFFLHLFYRIYNKSVWLKNTLYNNIYYLKN